MVSYQMIYHLHEDLYVKMRICVLVMVMSGLVMQSSQTSTGTESSLSNSSSPGLRTCYKCYNCATFEQVQAKVCDKPEEQFCSVSSKILVIFL